MKINDKTWKVNTIMTFYTPVDIDGSTQMFRDIDLPEKEMIDRESFVQYLYDTMFNRGEQGHLLKGYLWKISCSLNITNKGGLCESNSELGEHFKRWFMGFYSDKNGKFYREDGDFECLMEEV